VRADSDDPEGQLTHRLFVTKPQQCGCQVLLHVGRRLILSPSLLTPVPASVVPAPVISAIVALVATIVVTIAIIVSSAVVRHFAAIRSTVRALRWRHPLQRMALLATSARIPSYDGVSLRHAAEYERCAG
jgi:hypothetical protein